MKKWLNCLLLMAVLAAVLGLTGCDLFSDVELPGAVPSGFAYLDFSNIADFSADSRLWIAFDPDRNVCDGDEHTLSLPLGAYLVETTYFDIYVVLPWSAPEVPEGSYYVYCWIDTTADGVMDSDEGTSYSALHGSSVGYEFSYGVDTVTIYHASENIEVLFPTCRVDGGPVPQIDFYLSGIGAY